MIGSPTKSPETTELTFDDHRVFQEVAGELGANLRLVAKAFGVKVDYRGSKVRILGGDGEKHASAISTIQAVYDLVKDGHVLEQEDMRHAIGILKSDNDAQLTSTADMLALRQKLKHDFYLNQTF